MWLSPRGITSGTSTGVPSTETADTRAAGCLARASLNASFRAPSSLLDITASPTGRAGVCPDIDRWSDRLKAAAQDHDSFITIMKVEAPSANMQAGGKQPE